MSHCNLMIKGVDFWQIMFRGGSVCSMCRQEQFGRVDRSAIDAGTVVADYMVLAHFARAGYQRIKAGGFQPFKDRDATGAV